jgi:hypothetical protein
MINAKRVKRTPLESQMRYKYMALLKQPLTQKEFNQIIIDFKRDVEIIKKENPIYFNT